MLTLFALVLAIGIVVDDAIVVIENIERIMASEGLAPRSPPTRRFARWRGALVAIVLVLCAVFVPVAFIGGVTGEMFKQFAMTIVIAVVLSGVVALTLTPALCALLLTESNEAHTTGFFGAFNRLFTRVTNGYAGAVGSRARPAAGSGSRHSCVIVGLAGVILAAGPDGVHPDGRQGILGARRCSCPTRRRCNEPRPSIRRVERIPPRGAGGGERRRVRGARSCSRRTNATNSATIFINC